MDQVVLLPKLVMTAPGETITALHFKHIMQMLPFSLFKGDEKLKHLRSISLWSSLLALQLTIAFWWRKNKWVHIIVDGSRPLGAGVDKADVEAASEKTTEWLLNTQSTGEAQRVPDNKCSPDNILQCLQLFYESDEVSTNYTGLYYACKATKVWWLNKWVLLWSLPSLCLSGLHVSLKKYRGKKALCLSFFHSLTLTASVLSDTPVSSVTLTAVIVICPRFSAALRHIVAVRWRPLHQGCFKWVTTFIKVRDF